MVRVHGENVISCCERLEPRLLMSVAVSEPHNYVVYDPAGTAGDPAMHVPPQALTTVPSCILWPGGGNGWTPVMPPILPPVSTDPTGGDPTTGAPVSTDPTQPPSDPGGGNGDITGPDLSPDFDNAYLPDTLAPGQTVSIVVDVNNWGDTTAQGSVTVQIYAATWDDAGNEVDYVLGSTTQDVSLDPYSDPAQVSVDVASPDNMPDGTYEWMAKVSSSNIADQYPDDDTVDGGSFDAGTPTADLGTSVDDYQFPDTVLPGSQGTVLVDVANWGDAAASGSATISVYVSAVGDMSDAVLIGSLNTKLNLDSWDDNEFNVNVQLPSKMQDGDYYLVSNVTSKSIDESDTTNNWAASWDTIYVETPSPDLSVNVNSFSWPDAILPGSKGTVNFDVYNGGNAATNGSTTFNFYASSDGSLSDDDVPLGSMTKGLTLAPDGDVNVTGKVALPKSIDGGDYYLIVAASSNSYTDANPDDNAAASYDTFEVVPPTIDLTGTLGDSGFDGDTIVAGQKSVATVTVSDEGNVRATGRIGISVYASTDDTLSSDDILLGIATNKMVNLQPGSQKDFKVLVQLPAGMAADSYYLITKIDSGTVQETDTDNNVALADQELDVQAPAVDLTGDVQVSLGDQVLAGATGTAYVDVTNLGNIQAKGKMAITIYASSTGEFDGTAVPIGTLTGKAVLLKPNQTKTYTVNVTIPGNLPADDYFLFAQIDSANQITNEIDYSNNVLLADQTVTVLPSTIDLGVAFNGLNLAQDLQVGDTGSADVLVTNYGTVKAAGRVTVDVYASANPAIDDTAVLIGETAGKPVILDPNGSYDYGVNLSIPASLSGGSYFLLAKITTSLSDTNDANNTVLSYSWIEVA